MEELDDLRNEEIDLEDRDDDDDDDDEEENNINDMFEGLTAKRDVWKNSAKKTLKNEIIRELIRCFGSMVSSSPKQYALPNSSGKYRLDDLEYSKLLDASKYVVRAKEILLKNENFDTRECTLYIARKKWMHGILAPLIGLCNGRDGVDGDDLGLTMRCCGLAIVLIKRLSDSAMKFLADASGSGASKRHFKRKAKASLVISNDAKTKKSKDDDAEDDFDEAEEREKEDKVELVDKANRMEMANNAKQQVGALLSFKDALSNFNANTAISNAFRVFWLQEQQAQQQAAMREGFNSEENKQGVAICFSYVRRLLAIRPHIQFSAEGEHINYQLSHHRCIVQLRCVLSVIPGVCSDILRNYHDDWLSDILLIIFYCLQGMDVKELFGIWRSGSLADDLEDEEDIPSATNAKKSSSGKILLPVVIPETLPAMAPKVSKGQASAQALTKKVSSNLVQNSTKGLLSSRLKVESINRSAHLAAHSNSTSAGYVRPGNFSGVFTVSNTLSQRSQDHPGTEGSNAAASQSKQYLTNPFQKRSELIPQAKQLRRRSKLTFSDTSLEANMGKSSSLISSGIEGLQERHKACVVAASLVNLLSQDFALKPLVKRVNEDLRRDEMRVGPDLELRYFESLSIVLTYNRFKVRHHQAQQIEDHKRKGDAIDADQPQPPAFEWQPNLVNVMDALDRMSFRRVTAAIERTLKTNSCSDVLHPMTLLKEMICYLRILLESSLEGHHEISISALYRLFYASSDRLDPIPKLLGDWKPGIYSRQHMDVLVELVHETLKTLEAAKNLYRNLVGGVDVDDEEDLKKKLKMLNQKRKTKKEMGMELYITSCLKFNVDDYFKRLASNHTVIMYTKMLANYQQNSAPTNHYIYSYLRRMCTYNLEQNFHAPTAVELEASSLKVAGQVHVDGGAESSHKVNLGYMLFNANTLAVINTILNDPTVQAVKHMEPLIRLLKNIIRNFTFAASKNHLVFVEALFQHPRPAEHCCLVDNIYEVSMYKPSVFATDRAAESTDSEADAMELPADIFQKNTLNLRLEDEFEYDGADDLNVLNNSTDAATTSAALSSPDEVLARQRRMRLKQAATKAGEKKKRTSRWTPEEDAVLRRLYDVYAGTSSVFTAISQSEELLAVSGQPRSVTQVTSRVRQLQLHIERLKDKDQDGDDRGEDGSDGDEHADKDDDNDRPEDATRPVAALVAYSQDAQKTLSALDLLDLDKQMESSSDSERENARTQTSSSNRDKPQKKKKKSAKTATKSVDQEDQDIPDRKSSSSTATRRRISLKKSKSTMDRSVSDDEEDLLDDSGVGRDWQLPKTAAAVSVSVSVSVSPSQSKRHAEDDPEQRTARDEKAKKLRKAMVMLSDSDEDE